MFSNLGLCQSGADQRDYLFFIAQGYYKLGVSVGSVILDVHFSHKTRAIPNVNTQLKTEATQPEATLGIKVQRPLEKE